MRGWCNHCGRREAIDTRGQCTLCLDETVRATGRHAGQGGVEADPAAEAAGREAAVAAAGKTEATCPHDKGAARYWWFRGYFEAKG